MGINFIRIKLVLYNIPPFTKFKNGCCKRTADLRSRRLYGKIHTANDIVNEMVHPQDFEINF